MSVAHLAMEHVSDPVTEQTGFWEVSARNESPESGRMSATWKQSPTYDL